jgi:outer membrane protein assembly factor BamB
MIPSVSRLVRIAATLSGAALLVSSCGTVRPSASAAPGAEAVTAPGPVPRSSGTSCQDGPARRAFAELVTAAGRVAWQDRLPTNPAQQGVAVQPLTFSRSAGGPVDVFGEYDTVYGLRESDGHRLWTWTGGQLIYGLWGWHGTAVVLSGQVGTHAEVTEVDASTGMVRWTLPLPGPGLLGSQAMTADGGLAMVVPDGTLELADLATGRLRWAHSLTGSMPSGPQPTPQAVNANVSPAPAAVGPVVVEGSGGRVYGYDSRTGALRWTAAGMPAAPLLATDGGLVLMTSSAEGAGLPTAVIALSAATGRVAWRFDAGVPAWVEGSGPAGIVLATNGPDFLYLADPATGRVRWKAATFVQNTGEAGQPLIAAVTTRDVTTPEGGSASQRQRIVDRSAADGAVRWAVPVAGSVPTAVPVLAVGSRLVTVADLNGAGAGTLSAVDQATGHPGWRVRMPTTLWVPPALAASGVLAQSTDASYGCAAVGSAGGAAPAVAQVSRSAAP